MKADLVIMPEEVAFLDKIFSDFELSLDEFDHTESLDLDSLSKVFSTFSDEVKSYSKNIFMDMAKCDGYVDPRELSIINHLCK
ncbi:MAG: hypothetical protein LUD48_07075 [Prevotella sp.]|nr:hypothetical protein [Prevotella sp.]